MNKSYLHFAVLIIISTFAFFACKKENDLHPYQNNYRIVNFTKKTTRTDSVINDNYGFTYDIFNRVVTISHTTNRINANNFISYLTYKNDTIYDTTRFVNGIVYSVDTFVTDLTGNIVATFMAGVAYRYNYLNDLLTRKTFANNDFLYYTSYNGNMIKQLPSKTGYDTIDYHYYTDLNNRPGDYFHLNDMARYGYSFRRNTNLIKDYLGPNDSVVVEYTIDAYNKISKVRAYNSNRVNTQLEDYDIQYEKYK